ncbi:sulfite exporter TauE/SafE family protein [Pelagibaculum spongiae]|uniref:Probable membrane transporter protein n=1 Tax=Pelagibaculum spongiae TaxID=2080658 RepID=A0A2V1GW60_9GAMM|nr:sulfite exporter TauE/SafE family protein [Pelagibaculum spongiae]PVZ69564.1 hypothetical protein DC094_09610 [Pelagibaculum spongiae]
MELIGYIIAGSLVGFVVGMTGVGGGSLMTPLLLFFGFPPATAIGTDLLFAAITKSSGTFLHNKSKTIDWTTVGWLASGSLPATLVTIYGLNQLEDIGKSYEGVLTVSLGVMLILTSLVLLYRNRIQAHPVEPGSWLQRHRRAITLITGVALGVLVTLSSVGAGAFGAAILMYLYPHMSNRQIVGTDLAHAIPLTALAGLGHLHLGNVDFQLLGALLVGSLPAIYFGTKLGAKLPDKVMKPILASALMLLGIKYALF